MNRPLNALAWFAAGLLVFLLPFTSFPPVARLIHSSMVAPLSLLPLVALLIFWLLPYLLRGGGLPPQARLLIGFALVALVSALLAVFQPIPPFKGATILQAELEALVTLAVGISFYLVVATWAKDSDRLCFLLRWINWGGLLMIAWTAFQTLMWLRLRVNPDWMIDLQGIFSNSLLLYGERVNGFAYEPSWLAHQLNMLYLPIWLASSVNGFTAHRFRVGKIHVEHFLLAGGILALILSKSRIGWLTFLLMVAYLLLLWNIRLVRWAQARLFKKRSQAGHADRWRRRGFVGASLLVLGATYVGLLLGSAYIFSRYDSRMKQIFDVSAIQEFSFMHYANQLVFAERVVFWQAGWEVFNDYPVLGVGLGNAGFFFPQKLSGFSWALTEVRTIIYRWGAPPNIKSLWVRLLAETGLIGFGIFICWGYVLWKSARFLASRSGGLMKTMGLVGTFVLVGLVVEGFSLDTFALPYYWISLGLMTAACGQAIRFERQLQEPVAAIEGGRNEE